MSKKNEKLCYVGKSVPKMDSQALLLGKGVYLDDIVSKQCLCVKILRSLHANAFIKEIHTEFALKIPDVVAVYTYQDVPRQRFTQAGQSYPEPSPYDRLILDRHVRFVGDAVAIVAAETEEAADKALHAIRVSYEVQEAILDFRKAKDAPVLVHPEDSWKTLTPVGADNQRNLCASGEESDGDVQAVLDACDIVFTNSYHIKAVNQTAMETFRTYTEIDSFGRLRVISSTQIVFHVRRILSNALGIPKSKIVVEKPRIGGGFGSKQTAVAEVYPAFVTWKTKRPAKIIYTRKENLIEGSPRHEMEVRVTLGAMKDGRIRAMDVYTLSNTGAYGEHGPTTVGLSGHKSIPLYTNSLEAYRFSYDVVYTNLQSSGAYRGYGATQGIFAVESMVNELAEKISMDPVELRMMNMVREGQTMSAYYNETVQACALDRCMMKCAENFGWAEKFPVRDMGDGKLRCAGVAMAMQGSGISNVDVGSATMKCNDDGCYTLIIGAADMGTGCDTILAQIAAECMECSLENISVSVVNTDSSPYDSGSYASSTTYVTGKAVEKACHELKANMIKLASQMLSLPEEELVFEGSRVSTLSGDQSVSLTDIATKSMVGNTIPLSVTATNSSAISPPPFGVGMVEIELDTETGLVKVLNYHAVIDCGTVVNPSLARIQTEGGIVQGLGMALTEDIHYDTKGRLAESSLMQYRIPTRLDIDSLHVDFVESYETTGPFGAKSIGELVINPPAPAIAHAIARATKSWHRTLPITPEKILFGLQ